MLKDKDNIQMPVRSRLFNLPMVGLCGATQESILSYTHRVCAEHHVPARRMMREFILPETGLSGLLSIVRSNPLLASANILSLNGSSEHSATFSAAMQKLTGRQGLSSGTFLSWQGLLGRRIAMAPSRQWCPHCLAQQSDREHVSFSLIWAPMDVRACPIHKAMLLDRCARCDRTQPILSDHLTRGQCEHCRLELGNSLQCEAASKASDRDVYVAEAVAEMVWAGSSDMEFATAARHRSRLQEIADENCGGSLQKLGTQLQLGRTLRDCTGRTTLPTFLEVTYRLGVKPLTYLQETGSVNAKYQGLASSGRSRRHMTPDAADELRGAFSTIIKESVQVPDQAIVISEVARRLRVPALRLFSRFPDLVKVVREHNVRARTVRREKQRVLSELAARAAMRDLVEQNGRVTARAFRKALTDAGIHWTLTEARAAANDELTRLLPGVG